MVGLFGLLTGELAAVRKELAATTKELAVVTGELTVVREEVGRQNERVVMLEERNEVLGNEVNELRHALGVVEERNVATAAVVEEKGRKMNAEPQPPIPPSCPPPPYSWPTTFIATTVAASHDPAMLPGWCATKVSPSRPRHLLSSTPQTLLVLLVWNGEGISLPAFHSHGLRLILSPCTSIPFPNPSIFLPSYSRGFAPRISHLHLIPFPPSLILPPFFSFSGVHRIIPSCTSFPSPTPNSPSLPLILVVCASSSIPAPHSLSPPLILLPCPSFSFPHSSFSFPAPHSLFPTPHHPSLHLILFPHPSFSFPAPHSIFPTPHSPSLPLILFPHPSFSLPAPHSLPPTPHYTDLPLTCTSVPSTTRP
ncbi:unnamed protein product [Closterium sp. NIES-65]|nr:unnamed protein product [Closterium sp. NIES-65]